MDKVTAKDLGGLFQVFQEDYGDMWPFNENFSETDEAYVETMEIVDAKYVPAYVFLKKNNVLRVKISIGDLEINATTIKINKISYFEETVKSGLIKPLDTEKIVIHMDNQKEFVFLRPDVKLVGPGEMQMGFSKIKNVERYENFINILKSKCKN